MFWVGESKGWLLAVRALAPLLRVLTHDLREAVGASSLVFTSASSSTPDALGTLRAAVGNVAAVDLGDVCLVALLAPPRSETGQRGTLAFTASGRAVCGTLLPRSERSRALLASLDVDAAVGAVNARPMARRDLATVSVRQHASTVIGASCAEDMVCTRRAYSGLATHDALPDDGLVGGARDCPSVVEATHALGLVLIGLAWLLRTVELSHVILHRNAKGLELWTRGLSVTGN